MAKCKHPPKRVKPVGPAVRDEYDPDRTRQTLRCSVCGATQVKTTRLMFGMPVTGYHSWKDGEK